MEIQDLDPTLKSDDGSDSLSKYHKECINLLCDATKAYGKPVPRPEDFKPWLDAAGFVDVKEYYFKIPINNWPKDKALKEIGKYQCVNYCEGLEGITVALFTRVLEWQQSEIQVFLAKIRAEMRDRNIHAYQTLYVSLAVNPEHLLTGR